MTAVAAVAPLLAVDDLAVSVDGRGLLEDVSFRLEAGEALVLGGRSGLGKTSLLRTIAALRDPDRGSIRLDGRTPAEWSWPAYRRRVTLVQQQPALLEGTVSSNLRRPFAFRASRCGYPEGRDGELLQALGLGSGVLSSEAAKLSVGERQRICLVRALLVEPAVLVLDEPTSALDEASARLVTGVLDRERRLRGLALLVVTHDRNLAAGLEAREMDLNGMATGEGSRG